MNKYKFQLISSLIYIIFTVSTLTGQSCDDLAEHINNQTLDVLTGTGTSNAIYSSYSSTGNSTWAEQNWTGQVDFSGVAFDSPQTFTLISPRHVLMATHYPRSVGSTVVFHDSDGVRHSAILIARQSVPNVSPYNPDITVGLLDVDVPVKYYRVLSPDADWITYLEGALVVSTHHTRNASIREVNHTSGKYIGFRQSSAVPTSYYAPAVSGNSGNPSFLLINGEPILISTFTFSSGTGPFFSEPSNFNAINSIMTSLGGGYQLETIDACGSLVCPPDYLFSGNGGLTDIESSTVLYETDGQIESTQLISTTADVSYDSGIAIDLLSGFEVAQGAEFRAYIDGCGGAMRVAENKRAPNEYTPPPSAAIINTSDLTLRNYPNPFNGQTTIEYSLPTDSRVMLVVTDLTGKQIAVLVNDEQQTKGIHNVSFDGSNYPTGMYYYTIRADNYLETQKMTLVK